MSKSIPDQLLANAIRRDEQANVELAASIVRRKDAEAVAEVFAQLSNKKLQSDGIRILHEVAARDPAMVADYGERLIELTASKNNRIAWEAMTAVDAIAPLRSDVVYAHLGQLRGVAEAGSVIARDHFVNILLTLAPLKADVLPLLLEQFANCPPNQLPMYAERGAAVLRKTDAAEFVEILTHRANEMKTEARPKRLEKIIKQLRGK